MPIDKGLLGFPFGPVRGAIYDTPLDKTIPPEEIALLLVLAAVLGGIFIHSVLRPI